jgi:hypothetical protein
MDVCLTAYLIGRHTEFGQIVIQSSLVDEAGFMASAITVSMF